MESLFSKLKHETHTSGATQHRVQPLGYIEYYNLPKLPKGISYNTRYLCSIQN